MYNGVQRGYLFFLKRVYYVVRRVYKRADYGRKNIKEKLFMETLLKKIYYLYSVWRRYRIYGIEEYFEKQFNIPYPQFKPNDKTLEMKQQYIF